MTNDEDASVDQSRPSGHEPSCSTEPDVENTGSTARLPTSPGREASGSSRRGVRRALVLTGQSVTALVSVLTLAATAIGWVGLDHAQGTTTDVLTDLKDAPPTRDGALDILLVGNDARTDAQGEPLPPEILRQLRTEATSGVNTDTIMVLRIPDNGTKAYAISIPRDVYVLIPGHGNDRINAAYGTVKALWAARLRNQGTLDHARIELESDQEGRRALVQAVHEVTGLRVDHYAEVNLLGFHLLTEAVGGVEVCLNAATRDADSGADFRAGVQTIKGGDALSFVRQRKNLPRGDLDRIVRQQTFLSAVMRRLLSTGTITDPGRMADLIAAGRRSVVLDRGWDLLAFADRMRALADGKVEFVTIPVDTIAGRGERGQSIVEIDKAHVHQWVAELLTPKRTAVDVTAVPKPAVELHDATGRPGLAAEAGRRLATKGLTSGVPVNATVRERSVIRVPPGGRATATTITEALGAIEVVEDDSVTHGTVVVVLGADHRPPGGRFAPRRAVAPRPERVAELGHDAGAGQYPARRPPEGGPPCVN